MYYKWQDHADAHLPRDLHADAHLLRDLHVDVVLSLRDLHVDVALSPRDLHVDVARIPRGLHVDITLSPRDLHEDVVLLSQFHSLDRHLLEQGLGLVRDFLILNGLDGLKLIPQCQRFIFSLQFQEAQQSHFQKRRHPVFVRILRTVTSVI